MNFDYGRHVARARETLGRLGAWLKRAPVRRGLLAGFAVLVVFLGGLAGLIGYQLYSLPLPSAFAEPKNVALDFASANGDILGTRGVSRGRRVELAEVPKHLIDAVLAIEDRRFFSHGGVDWRGTMRAGYSNVAAGEVVEGGSTITQQLAKNLFLSPEKTFSRKFQEALIAWWLERRLTKPEILTLYLNSIYLGAGAYGVDAAAHRYFAKPAKDVTLAEAAMIAGLIQAPSRLSPARSLETAQERARVVLHAMVDNGVLSREQANKAAAEPAKLAMAPADSALHGYALDWAATETRAMLGDVSGDFVAETTIVPSLQELAQQIVAASLDKEGEKLGVTQAALVAMRPDGAVLAVVGGRDYRQSQFNRAVLARRQPGSIFKLFVYAAAMRAGLRPESPILDAPVTIDGWTADNYDGRFLSETTLRTAFAQSLNAAAVRLQERVGRQQVIATAKEMGLTAPLTPIPSLALGSMESTLVELTAAFAAVRADAVRIEPYIVRAVRGPAEAIFAKPRPLPSRADGSREAVISLLQEVVRSGTGRAAALNVPAFGKTGTTEDYRDAWFIGYAGDLVVGVWTGNDDGKSMNKVTGGSLPARIWHAFMTDALAPGRQRAVVALAPLNQERLLVGSPAVVDTGTLRIGNTTLRLEGVQGIAGAHARDMSGYIGGRDVSCRPVVQDRYRCEVDGWDLSEVTLFNGGGRATADAPPALVDAERKARSAGRGIWGAQR